MNEKPRAYHCILCGKAFLPSHPDEARCPEHGGEGRLVSETEPVDKPQRTKLGPAGPGEPTRLDDGSEGQPTKRDDGSRGTLVDGDPSLPGEKPPISLGEESEEGKGDGEPVQTEAGVPVAWEIGDRILDLYEVKGVLGKGGFGVVYRVYHTAWDLDLAVKSPLAKKLKEGGTEDFVSEAEDWMDLGLHPHITTCHYVRTLGGVPRVFAELVEGGSLHDWMTKGRLYEGTQEETLKRLLDIAIQFAWGLDYAHEQGMIHQDVKPENALMTEGGSVKVTDFGLVSAKAVDEEVKVKAGDRKEDKSLLVQGRGMTPAYCSPEQSMGQMLSRRTDLWSWGLSVLALYAGERFWGKRAQWATGPLAEDYLNHYLEEGPKRAGIPRMPEGLVSLLQEVFQEDPEDRPHDMEMAAQRVIEVYEQELGEPYPREKPEAAELRADSLNNRALSLMDLGRVEAAMEAWEHALEMDPSHPQAVYNYGLYRWRIGKTDDWELVRRLSEVIGAQPNAWEPLYLLALVHMERDDCQGVIELLETIPQEQSIREEAGQLLAKAQARLPNSTRCLRTFGGHEDTVRSVSLDADEKYALSGSEDKTLKLWDVKTGECLRTFKGHQGGVSSAQLSTDSRYALSGSLDNSLKLWDVETGDCVRTFEGHGAGVNSIKLSSDGQYVLSGSSDCSLKLWEIETGTCLHTFDGHGWLVLSVDLSVDDQWALSGSDDNTLKLWDVESGACLCTFEGHKRRVSSVQISPDCNYALSGGGLSIGVEHDNTIKLWDVDTGKCLRTLDAHEDKVTSVQLRADTKIALSGSSDNSIKIWDLESGICLRTCTGHEGGIFSLHLCIEGRTALSGGGDNTLKLWHISQDGAEFQAPARLSMVVQGEGAAKREARVKELINRADEKKKKGRYQEVVALVREARSIPGYKRSQHTIKAWSSLYRSLPRGLFRSGWEVRTFERHSSGVNAIHFSKDGEYVLSGSRSDNIKLWDVNTGECLRTFYKHKRSVYAVYLKTDGRHALTGGDDDTIKLWELETGKVLRSYEGHTYWVTSVDLSTDGRIALSGSMDETLKLWDIKTGICLRTFDGHEDDVNSVCFSTDGLHALSGSDDETLRLWDVEACSCLRTFHGHEKGISSVQLSADGCFALSGSWDGTLKWWDVETGMCLRTFEGHNGGVTSVQLSADRSFAVSGSLDKTLRLWDMNNGNCLRTLQGHSKGIKSVCLTNDGRYVLSGSGDGILKLWFLDWELEAKEPADWDEGARPYLENFLILQTPYAGEIPQDREPTEEEIQQTLTRKGAPTWTEEDFQHLLTKLGYAGYGWLRPEGVRQKLQEMVRERG